MRKKKKNFEEHTIVELNPKYRELYLFGPIDTPTAGELIFHLRQLDRTRGPIQLVLSSLGGEEGAGWGIYDAIRTANNDVHCYAYGECQSIATLIIQACKTRMLSENTRFMIHNGGVAADMTTNQVIALAKEVEALSAMYYSTLSLHSGVPAEEIQSLCANDYYMSAATAVQRGFADGIIKKNNNVRSRRGKKRAK